MSSASIHWLAAVTLALGLPGCIGAQDEDASAVGALVLPLRSTGSDGTDFGLTGTFELSGPESITRTVALGDMDFDADLLTLEPRVGSYELTISSWQLYDLSGMAPMAAPATLLDPATQDVEILNGETTDVVYRFTVPGKGPVVFARGTLAIDFTVTEGFPDGSSCMTASVCESHVCTMFVCAAPTCSDGVLNGDETSPDCGGSCGACGP